MFLFSLISIYNADIINITVENILYKQILWIFIGSIFTIIICNIKNEFIYKNIKYFYILFNMLLGLLLIFGKEINHAKCWFKIPGIGTFQPSETMKVILIIYISSIIVNFNKKKAKKSFYNDLILFIIVFTILFIPSILTFLEPDTGAVLMYIISIFIILYFNGFDNKWWFILFSIIISIISFILYLYFFNRKLFVSLLGNTFFLRVERLINWINLDGMQLKNSIISIGSSGLIGNYFSNDVYFPEAHTDFIFSVFSSNFGFIGSIFLIITITIFDLEILSICKKSKKSINKYVVIGFLGLLMYQQIQNISMTIGLLPITGITLPFISYGGSSLVNYMIIMGIIFNINYENQKYKN